MLIEQLSLELFWPFMENLIVSNFEKATKIGPIEALAITDAVLDILPLKDIKIKWVFLPGILKTLLSSLKVHYIFLD